VVGVGGLGLGNADCGGNGVDTLSVGLSVGVLSMSSQLSSSVSSLVELIEVKVRLSFKYGTKKDNSSSYFHFFKGTYSCPLFVSFCLLIARRKLSLKAFQTFFTLLLKLKICNLFNIIFTDF
jgi:hypothetical protein